MKPEDDTAAAPAAAAAVPAAVTVHMYDIADWLVPSSIAAAAAVTDEPLGDHYDASSGSNTISVWAPTAQQVELLHWQEMRGGEPEVLPMTRNNKGVWQYNRPKEWEGT